MINNTAATPNFFGEVDQKNGGNFEMGGGDIQPIPAGTQVLAAVEEAKNTVYENSKYINIKWRVAQPAEYANRVIFQKVHCYDEDQAKALRGKQMLFAIATNTGGKLFESMQSANETEPSDASLTRITALPMVLKLEVWKQDKDKEGNAIPLEKQKSGNWVQAVSARKPSANQQPMQQQVKQQPIQQQQMQQPMQQQVESVRPTYQAPLASLHDQMQAQQYEQNRSAMQQAKSNNEDPPF